MTFLSRIGFLTSSILLSISVQASEQDGSSSGDQLSLSVPPPFQALTPAVPEDEARMLGEYGPEAYKAFFRRLNAANDGGAAKNTIRSFIITHKKKLTPALFYAHVLDAEQSKTITYVQRALVESVLKGHLVSCAMVPQISKGAEPEQSGLSFILNIGAGRLREHLLERVVGEDNAMGELAMAVDRHFRSLVVNEMLRASGREELATNKMNILLIGPTGCGKTASITQLSKLLKVPFSEGDASTLTRSGYVGDSVGVLIEGLLKACDYDVAKAEKGIIFIDEIDKIREAKNLGGRDIAGGDVQAELLKMIEGKTVVVKRGLGSLTREYSVCTRNILFIGGGAFSSLPVQTEYTAKDLVDFGMKPELMGRFGRFIALEGVTEAKLCQILKSSTASPFTRIKLITKLGYGVDVSIDESCFPLIAKEAFECGTGVRGLTTVLDRLVETLALQEVGRRDDTVITKAMVEKFLEEPRAKREKTDSKHEAWKNMYI